MNDHLLMRSAVFIELVSLSGRSGVSRGIRREYADGHLRDIAKSRGQ
jgi:hypothetical protein